MTASSVAVDYRIYCMQSCAMMQVKQDKLSYCLVYVWMVLLRCEYEVIRAVRQLIF